MNRLCLTLLILIFCTVISLAQDTCPAIDEALLSALEDCVDAERGTVCYGAEDIAIESDAGETNFESPGDSILLSGLIAIETLSDDEIALMQLNREDVSLRVIAYGEASLENTAPRNSINIYALRGVNLRLSPSLDATVISSLSQGRDYTAIGRLDDNTWIQVQLEDGRTGWSSAQYFVTEDSFTELDAVTPTTPPYLPMQALTLQTENCGGVLLIAPEIEEEAIIFGINGSQIQVNGIVLVQTDEDILEIISIAGENLVNTFGFESPLLAGEMTTIPLSASGSIASIAEDVEIYEGMILEDETIPMLLDEDG